VWDLDEGVLGLNVPDAAVDGDGHAPAGERDFKLPWREAGPLNHHDDLVDSDQ